MARRVHVARQGPSVVDGVVVRGTKPWFSALSRSKFGISRHASGCSAKRHARPPSRLRPPPFQLAGAGAAQHEAQAVAFDEAMHFVEQRRHLPHLVHHDGAARAAAPRAGIRSRKSHGAQVSSSSRRVSSKSKRVAPGNRRSSKVDLPVLRGPHKNAEQPAGSLWRTSDRIGPVFPSLRISQANSDRPPNWACAQGCREGGATFYPRQAKWGWFSSGLRPGPLFGDGRVHVGAFVGPEPRIATTCASQGGLRA